MLAFASRRDIFASGMSKTFRTSESGETDTPESGHALDLGAFIRQHRERSAISLRKLADIAGISNPYLSQIERGLRGVCFVCEFCKLGCPASVSVNDDELHEAQR